MTPDQMIHAVLAGLAPGADSAIKAEAAVVLRGLLGALEGTPGAGVGSGPGAVSLSATPPPAAGESPGAPDALGRFIELISTYLPAGALDGAVGVRLNIPFMPGIALPPKK